MTAQRSSILRTQVLCDHDRTPSLLICKPCAEYIVNVINAAKTVLDDPCDASNAELRIAINNLNNSI